MRSRIQTICLACALLLGAGRSGLAQAPAAPEQAEIPKVSIEFAGVGIHDAMELLAAKTGIDFIVTPGVEGKLTAKFIDERLDKILRIVGLTLGLEVRLIEGIFVLSKPGVTPAALPGAEVGPATEAVAPVTGAGALLPGTVPTAPLSEAGEAPSLVGGPAGAGTAPPQRRTVTQQIPVESRQASEIAKALGGGYIDAQGRGHAPGTGGGGGGLPTAGVANADPYRNLPPGARVSRNGTIMMPNGTTILRSGLVILPNGTVIQPGTVPYITVPYGTTAGQLQQQWSQPYNNPYYQPQGTIQGNAGGFGFGLAQNGQAYVQPPSINLGGNATLTLPGVQIGGQNNTVVQPNQIQAGPTLYPGTGSPNVHYGAKPSNWFYGLPPDWHFTPPVR